MRINELPGLAYWLNTELAGLTDGATVEAAPDFSGHARELGTGAFSERPTYQADGINSHPALQFADGDFRERAGTDVPESQTWSVFAVVQRTGAPSRHLGVFSANSAVSFVARRNATGNRISVWDSNNLWNESSATLGTDPALIEWELTGGPAGRARIWLDGELVLDVELTQALGSAGGRFLLGSTNNTSTQSFEGMIGDTIALTTHPTTAQRDAVRRYLADAYGLTVTLSDSTEYVGSGTREGEPSSDAFEGIDGLNLWLEGADISGVEDEALTTWPDRSETDAILSADSGTEPRFKPNGSAGLNALPTVYAGRDYGEQFTSGALQYRGLSGFTIFAVVEQVEFDDTRDAAILSRDGSGNRGWEFGVAADGRAIFIVASGTNARVRRDGNKIDLRRMPALIRVRYDGASGEQSIWINGVNDDGSIDGSVPTTVGGTGPDLQVFNNGFSGPQSFGGHIGTVLAYGRALSDTECDVIETKLMEQYELVRLEEVAVSPDLNVHQGVATDGSKFYGTDTQLIRRFDDEWNTELTNADPLDGLSGLDHIGDGAYHDGKLIIPLNTFDPDTTSTDLPHIGVFDATTLAREAAHDITSDGPDGSALAVDTTRGVIWAASWLGDGMTLWKYDLESFELLGELELSESVRRIQGLSYNPTDGMLWASLGVPVSSPAYLAEENGRLVRIDPDTGLVRAVYRRVMTSNASQPEGIDASQTGSIYWLIDWGDDEFVHTLEPTFFGPSDSDSSEPEPEPAATFIVQSECSSCLLAIGEYPTLTVRFQIARADDPSFADPVYDSGFGAGDGSLDDGSIYKLVENLEPGHYLARIHAQTILAPDAISPDMPFTILDLSAIFLGGWRSGV